jgi:hypothetical protein
MENTLLDGVSRTEFRGQDAVKKSTREGGGRKWFLKLPTGDVRPCGGTPHDDPRHEGLALADRPSHRDERSWCD